MDDHIIRTREDGMSVLIDRPRAGVEYVSSFSVPAKLVKQAFMDLQPLMKKTAYSKVIGIEYSLGVMRVRASTSVIFDAEIPVVGDMPAEIYKVSCMYEDLSEMLPIKGDIKIMITPVFVQFQAQTVEANLTVCDDEIQESPDLVGNPLQIVLSDLKSGLKKLLSLTAISAVFKTGNVIVFAGDYMQIRYPTVWVQTPSSGLHTILDINSCSVLDRFIGSAREVNVYTSEDYIAIKKESSTLYITRQSNGDAEAMEEFLEDATLIDTVSILGLDKDCQSLLKTVGKVEGKVAVFDRGIIVEATTPSLMASIKNGNPQDSENLLETFTVRLEFLNNLLPILGESVKLYRKGDWICLKGPQALTIISSR
jgi:hypothetical protein